MGTTMKIPWIFWFSWDFLPWKWTFQMKFPWNFHWSTNENFQWIYHEIKNCIQWKIRENPDTRTYPIPSTDNGWAHIPDPCMHITCMQQVCVTWHCNYIILRPQITMISHNKNCNVWEKMICIKLYHYQVKVVHGSAVQLKIVRWFKFIHLCI